MIALLIGDAERAEVARVRAYAEDPANVWDPETSPVHPAGPREAHTCRLGIPELGRVSVCYTITKGQAQTETLDPILVRHATLQFKNRGAVVTVALSVVWEVLQLFGYVGGIDHVQLVPYPDDNSALVAFQRFDWGGAAK